MIKITRKTSNIRSNHIICRLQIMGQSAFFDKYTMEVNQNDAKREISEMINTTFENSKNPALENEIDKFLKALSFLIIRFHIHILVRKSIHQLSFLSMIIN